MSTELLMRALPMILKELGGVHGYQPACVCTIDHIEQPCSDSHFAINLQHGTTLTCPHIRRIVLLCDFDRFWELRAFHRCMLPLRSTAQKCSNLEAGLALFPDRLLVNEARHNHETL